MTRTIFVLNGPNLNLLGSREPAIYGAETLRDIEDLCKNEANGHALSIEFRQSNAEHELIEWVHEAGTSAQAIIVNPAAYTHTSIALLDALKAFDGPVVEVHLSNVHRREAFRHHSYVSLRADAVIAGCGAEGYVFAVRHVASRLRASG